MASWVTGTVGYDEDMLDMSYVDTSLSDEELIDELRETFAKSAEDLGKLAVKERPCDKKWPHLCRYAYWERGLDVEPKYHQQTGEKDVEVERVIQLEGEQEY